MLRFLGPLLLATVTTSSTAAQQTGPLQFSLPMDCTKSASCFLQNMMDMDPGPKRLDPLCGAATYNGHKGTDIRLRNLAEMKRGVTILAMANGKVLRTRDGVPDRLMKNNADKDALRGRECGNGLVIDHGEFGGKRWTSQICHMARGSLLVKSGEKVIRGQAIGKIGLSGATQFPHVHVSIREGEILRDLITGRRSGEACSTNSTETLLTREALSLLSKKDSALLETGFSDGAVNGLALLNGTTGKPGPESPLVFYAKFKNLRAGDRLELRITSSDGIFAQSSGKPLDKAKATFTAFVGKKTGSTSGVTYRGEARLLREGKIIFNSEPVSISF